MYLIAGGIVIIALAINLLFRPMKAVFKLLINSIAGLVLLWLANLIGGVVGFYLPYTLVNVLVSGIFGMPGVLALLVFRFLF